MPRPSRAAALAATLLAVTLSSACSSRLSADQCRDAYLSLPARERMAREPSSEEARREAAEQMQQWVVDHPECRP